MRTSVFPSLLLGVFVLIIVPLGRAEWTKDINCPSGTIYRDNRVDAGREEFCERLLPGLLRVKHGPSRFWFSVDHAGDEGSYINGRHVGAWKECNRFGKCKRSDYPLAYADEKDRTGFRPEIPVSYDHNKYVFDFTSCWSTWVTQSGIEDINFNIGGYGHRCVISYFPERVLEHGGEGTYICSVPFSVGVRRLRSLDLMREFTRLGLPQFCRPSSSKKGDVLMIVDKEFRDVASSVDVQCAAIERDANGEESLTFRLNQYAAKLANEIADSDGPLITRLCFGPKGPNEDKVAEMVHSPGGSTLFRYSFNNDSITNARQQKCARRAFTLAASCR